MTKEELEKVFMEPGTRIFREGEPGDKAYLIIDGMVEISKQVADSETSVIAALGKGEIIGEMSFIDEPRRPARARILEWTVFFVIDRDRYLQLMKRDSDLAVKLMWQLLQKLSRTLRVTNEMLLNDNVTIDESPPG